MSTSTRPSDTGRSLLGAIHRGVLPPPPAARLLRIDLVHVGDGETVFGFRADPAYGNPDFVHGGILAAIADFAVTTAIWTQVPSDTEIVTSDLHVSYLRPLALDGADFRCHGTVIHLGHTQANATAVVTAGDGTAHLHALATCRIRDDR